MLSLHSTGEKLKEPLIEKGGFGQKSIQNRLNKMQGQIQENFSGEKYQLNIVVPFPDPLNTV